MFEPETFRQRFPEFDDPAVYSDDVLGFWSGLALTLLNADRWGTSLDYGVSLYVAHHLALAARDQAAAKRGGGAGAVQGPLTSKTVDKVSASYDSKSIALTDAGFWNATSYGMRFYQLARMTGAGGIQL